MNKNIIALKYIKIYIRKKEKIMLIKCPECKSKVSDSAKICPKCGFAIAKMTDTEKKKQKPIGCVGILLSIFFIIWILDSTSQILKYTNTSTQQIDKENKPTISTSLNQLFEKKENRITFAYECKASVKKRLKNGESAKFKKIFFVLAKKNGEYAPITCGQVDAKNSLGAYSGFKEFVCTGELVFLEEDLAPKEWQKVWTTMCNGKLVTELNIH